MKKGNTIIKNIFRKIGIGITTYKELEGLIEYEKDCNSFLQLPKKELIKAISFMDKSKSQINQDLFVLSETGFKEGGFFVEFGATNGLSLSNTHLLEKEFNWSGILAEPAKGWHSELNKNRNCSIETKLVWRDSNSKLTFNEVDEKELSTIDIYNTSDQHKRSRKMGTSYEVETISLVDLLDKYHAPEIIDYLSIDTEGSEYEILSNFDFNKYTFQVITCEHNYTKNRQKIYNLLTSNGYQRKYTGFSKWDDWYVKR